MQQYEQNAEHLLAQYGKSFYWAGLILDKKKLLNAKRIYAFCRYVDDIVDESRDHVLAKVEIERIKFEIQNDITKNPIVRDTVELISQLQIPKQIVYDLIDGVSWDLKNNIIQTQEELLTYSYGVASTVGLLMCYILGVTDKRAYPFAIDLGIAMQLTNIARDVMTDAKMGRIYIPQSWFAVNVSAMDILSGKYQLQIYSHIIKLLDLAQKYYDSADKGLVYLPFRARASILVASRVYHEIGTMIIKNGQKKYFETERVFTTKLHKILITTKALGELLYRPMLYRPNKCHDSYLHNELKTIISYD